MTDAENPTAAKADQAQPDAQEEVEIRRAPKLIAFMTTGLILGLVAGFVLYVAIPDENHTSANLLGLLLITLGSTGFGFGILTSLAVDLISSRRVRTAIALREQRDLEA